MAIIASTISNSGLDSGDQAAGMKPFTRKNEGCEEPALWTWREATSSSAGVGAAQR
jgi:hypothetical protein